MNDPVLLALYATLGTWFATAMGAGAVLFFPSRGRRLMNAMLGFASGVMIAASFWSLLQPAIEQAEGGPVPSWLVAASGFLIGALFLWGTDRIVCSARDIPPGHPGSRILMLMLSITLHNIPEGFAVGVAFGALEGGDPEALMAAVSVAIGIGLQNIPEGAAVSLPLRREGSGKWHSFFMGQASALVEPVAGVIGALLVTRIRVILPWALSFAAGAMILVAVHELIPECQQARENHPYFATFGIILGFAVMMLLDVMLG